MMYFTEGADAVEDPAKLNGEFEAQCDAAVFEKKMAALMKDAYTRLKREDPASGARWDEAIDTLAAGDHYLLVMWNATAVGRISAAAFASLAVKLLTPLLMAGLALWYVGKLLGPGDHVGSTLLVLFFAGVLVFSILQALRPQALDWLMRRVLLYLFGRKDADKT